MSKLLLLDKDGTLVAPATGETFVQHPQDQVLLPGVANAITVAVKHRAIPVIVSNQGGVEAGFKSLEDAVAEMRYCLMLLPQIKIAYFCPDMAGKIIWEVERDVHRTPISTESFDSFRKPGAGMLQFAILWFSVEPKDCLMVGDRAEDKLAAVKASVPFISADQWRGV